MVLGFRVIKCSGTDPSYEVVSRMHCWPLTYDVPQGAVLPTMLSDLFMKPLILSFGVKCYLTLLPFFI